MRAFRTIAILVFSSIPEFVHGNFEPISAFFDLPTDLRKEGKPEWRAVFVDQRHHIDAAKEKFVVHYFKFFLREFEGLFNKILVFILHLLRPLRPLRFLQRRYRRLDPHLHCHHHRRHPQKKISML